MFNLIETAFAESGAQPTGGMLGSPIIMIVVMVAIFYFMLIRPENKRKKEAEQMRNSLKKGDWLTTIGGLYGKVVAITDRTVVLETSEDRVRMELTKWAVSNTGVQTGEEAEVKKDKKESADVPEEPAEIPAETEEK